MSTPAIDKVRDIVDRLPTTRDEDWKYTDLAKARDISAQWLDAGAEPPSPALADEIALITGKIDATWFVIENGRLVDAPDVEGVSVLGKDAAALADGALAELNASLRIDELCLRLDGEFERPFGILFIDGTHDDATVSQGHVAIEFSANSAASVIEFHASRGEADHYANSFVTLKLEDSAAVSHVRIQDRALHHLQTGRTTVTAGRNSRFTSACFDLGGGLIRNDLVIDIAGPGADVSFDGLYLAGDGQHIDNHTRVDHRVGPATSRQEYRGILNGHCRCVWNGKAIVHEGADGTDADQANHNLLLSTKAEIDAKPELEIYTDDVKCSHGTTVGQLDETALFYLRTRGLDKQQAKQVLTHAFAAGLVSRVPVDAAKETILQLMRARLGELIQFDEELIG